MLGSQVMNAAALSVSRSLRHPRTRGNMPRKECVEAWT
jgi:hypothetical protein